MAGETEGCGVPCPCLSQLYSDHGINCEWIFFFFSIWFCMPKGFKNSCLLQQKPSIGTKQHILKRPFQYFALLPLHCSSFPLPGPGCEASYSHPEQAPHPLRTARPLCWSTVCNPHRCELCFLSHLQPHRILTFSSQSVPWGPLTSLWNLHVLQKQQ